MGHRKIESVLTFDGLSPGDDPSYEINKPEDLCHLGLAGEITTSIKCSAITLPMLDKNKFDWKELLRVAIKETALQSPQRHVASVNEAILDFSREMSIAGLELSGGFCWESNFPALWFANKDTIKTLNNQVKTTSKNVAHYFVERCGLVSDMPNKIIALTPQYDDFGVLSVNEEYVNFFFIKERVKTYHLDDVVIE